MIAGWEDAATSPVLDKGRDTYRVCFINIRNQMFEILSLITIIILNYIVSGAVK